MMRLFGELPLAVVLLIGVSALLILWAILSRIWAENMKVSFRPIAEAIGSLKDKKEEKKDDNNTADWKKSQ